MFNVLMIKDALLGGGRFSLFKGRTLRVRHLVLHDFGGIFHFEFRFDKETEEGIVGEGVVPIVRVGGLEERHSIEEPEKEGHRVVGRWDLLVAQFLDETAVTMVHPSREQTEVVDGEVPVVAIDMVGLVARRYRTYPRPCGHEMCFVRFVHCSNLWVTRVHIFLSHELVPDGDELLDPCSIGRLAVDTHVACAPHVGYGIVRDECTIRECVRNRSVVRIRIQDVAVILVRGKRPD